ncbi:hypothetical protein [Paenibacillus beijingensis]|uniref:Membrane protein n=1 Tax=Paenibacillus beijingensis TaxID=1126833 RepID=A0A0D5NEK4_9BACL|nr:hypothetical protein [Paenibacillus beijingensis]AJY73809.1 membrane protein [Paenibacillus beijingensis]
MALPRLMRLITGVCELILGIPVIGGLIIIGTGYIPLTFMLILHILTLVVCVRARSEIHGSIVGIVTSFIAYIPFVGMIMHIITGLLLVISSASRSERYRWRS